MNYQTIEIPESRLGITVPICTAVLLITAGVFARNMGSRPGPVVAPNPTPVTE